MHILHTVFHTVPMLPMRNFLKKCQNLFYLVLNYFPVSHNISTLSNTYRVNPLLSSTGGLFISNPFEGGGGGGGGVERAYLILKR